MSGRGTVADRLVDAVHDGNLPVVVRELLASPAASAVDEHDHRLLEAAAEAVRCIGADGAAASVALSAALTRAGVEHRLVGPTAEALRRPQPELQRISLDLAVAPRAARVAVQIARSLGYRPWYHLEGGAWSAHRRLHPALPLVSETETGHPVLLHVRWRDGAQPADRGTSPGKTGRTRQPAARAAAALRRLRPSPRDLEAVRLPSLLWPLHVAVQPLLLLERKARGSATPLDLGPYLPTPAGIIDALLDLAGAGPDDMVADLGCGDGRVLIRAAGRGARAVGVERDPTLAGAARRAAQAAGVADRVEVILGDVEQLDLAPVTAVVLFLDAAVLPGVVDRLRSGLRPGSRVVAHEQALVAKPADRRCPVFTPAGITVAYRWDV